MKARSSRVQKEENFIGDESQFNFRLRHSAQASNSRFLVLVRRAVGLIIQYICDCNYLIDAELVKVLGEDTYDLGTRG